jgi:hypothetical protein
MYMQRRATIMRRTILITASKREKMMGEIVDSVRANSIIAALRMRMDS